MCGYCSPAHTFYLKIPWLRCTLLYCYLYPTLYLTPIPFSNRYRLPASTHVASESWRSNLWEAVIIMTSREEEKLMSTCGLCVTGDDSWISIKGLLTVSKFTTPRTIYWRPCLEKANGQRHGGGPGIYAIYPASSFPQMPVLLAGHAPLSQPRLALVRASFSTPERGNAPMLITLSPVPGPLNP